MEIKKRCANCKKRFSEVLGCYDWHGDGGICDKYEKKEREYKLEEKDGVKFVFREI